jgi:hypothetical protein
MRLDTQAYLAAGPQQQHLRIAVLGIEQDVGAAPYTLGGGAAAAIQRRHCLTRQNQRHRFVPPLHDHAPCFDDFVGVRRPQRDQPRNRAQRHHLLDRLMRRTIFADAN